MPESFLSADRPVLAVQSLTRTFDSFVAVDSVSFEVEEGGVFGLVGLNGAGKSTLIKMLTTLLPPSKGTATVCGHDITKEPAEVRRTIGYVPQLVSVDGDLTGRENLTLYAKLYDVPASERKRRVQEALSFMDLQEVGEKLVKHYSGGMVRRLEIAQSMLHRPKLLFLDEPTVGLDPVARASVWKHILELRDRFGATIFLTTHLLDEVERLCNRLAIMAGGKLIAIGSPDELKAAAGDYATLEDTFVFFTSGRQEAEEGFAATEQARRTARRLG